MKNRSAFVKIKNFLLFLALICVLCACGENKSLRSIYVMDSVATFQIYPQNEELVDEMCGKLYEIDRELSAYDGDIKNINDSSGGELKVHSGHLLNGSLVLSEKTGGAFSPVLGTVIELWGIGEKNAVPKQDELARAMSTSKLENVEIADGCVSLKNGVRLNFGAVAKGYASGVLREMLVENGVSGAVISLGGNVYVHGRKPDGSGWNVALRDPQGSPNDWFGSMHLTDRFVISSGDYERYFEKDGKRFHHIIDPETGSPAESDLTSVTVICEDGLLGDAYSTALYVMGRDAALSFWRKEHGFELVLVGRDGRVTLTEGIAGSFIPNESRGYIYEVENR